MPSPAVRRRFLQPFLALLVAAGLVAGARADSLDELRALLDAGNAADAWAMAQRMEDENAGDPDFDFSYGLAATQAQQPQRAVFAFERAHAAQPGNARFKLELARAYYLTGNDAESKRLFNEVLAITPPTPVERSIRTYLDAIAAHEQRTRTHVSGHVRLAAGYDSNTNSATDDSLNDFGPLLVLVGPTSVEQEGGFLDTRLGVDIVQPVNRRTTGFVSGQLHVRDNDDLFSGGDFDTFDAILTGGLLLQRSTATWRLPLTLQALTIDSDEARYMASFGTEYSRPQTPSRSLLLFGQIGATQYPSQEERDTWTALAGGGWTWSMDAWRVTATGYLGTEPARDGDFKFNGRDYAGARLSASRALVPGHTLYGNLGAQQSVYQEELVFEREDLLTDAAIGWQWQLDRSLAINADVSHALNASVDNSLYDYNRTQMSLAATWRF
ncbi:MAG: tetratricopeptide repeat protein [Pseudomonadota bacterium]